MMKTTDQLPKAEPWDMGNVRDPKPNSHCLPAVPKASSGVNTCAGNPLINRVMFQKFIHVFIS